MAVTDLTGYTWVGNKTLDYGQNIIVLNNLDFDFNYITENNATSYSTYEHANWFELNSDFGEEPPEYLTFGRYSSFSAINRFPVNTIQNGRWHSQTATGFANLFTTTDQATLLAMRTIKFNGGTDATNVALIAWLEANGTLTPPQTDITLDLSTIGLSEGTHSIQMKLSDGGVTKRDSALSNAVEYTVALTTKVL